MDKFSPLEQTVTLLPLLNTSSSMLLASTMNSPDMTEIIMLPFIWRMSFQVTLNYSFIEYVFICSVYTFNACILGYEDNFRIVNKDVSSTHGVPYDYWSVMHYGKNEFTNGNGLTINTKDPTYQDIIGQRFEVSPSDITELNLLYKCGKCNIYGIWYLMNTDSISAM